MNIFGFLMAFTQENLIYALDIFWKGMLAIVIVLTIAFALTRIMVITSNRLDKKAEESETPVEPESKSESRRSK